MSAGCSGAEICSTVFGSEYCLLYNDPGLNYAEIEWWHLFASSWNGVSMMFTANRHLCEKSVVSGKWGCGAFSEWFQLRWPAELQDCHITVKELVPIVLAAGIWGKQWSGKNIMAYCDNEAVVAIVNKGDSRDEECMHLMRCLAFF